jgi:hypothetical protein
MKAYFHLRKTESDNVIFGEMRYYKAINTMTTLMKKSVAEKEVRLSGRGDDGDVR